MNKKIKINNQKYVQQIIKANNKNYNLQYKPTPILNGEYELDSYNGKLLENYKTFYIHYEWKCAEHRLSLQYLDMKYY